MENACSIKGQEAWF